jgi:hypothetical protein
MLLETLIVVDSWLEGNRLAEEESITYLYPWHEIIITSGMSHKHYFFINTLLAIYAKSQVRNKPIIILVILKIFNSPSEYIVTALPATMTKKHVLARS